MGATRPAFAAASVISSFLQPRPRHRRPRCESRSAPARPHSHVCVFVCARSAWRQQFAIELHPPPSESRSRVSHLASRISHPAPRRLASRVSRLASRVSRPASRQASRHGRPRASHLRLVRVRAPGPASLLRVAPRMASRVSRLASRISRLASRVSRLASRFSLLVKFLGTAPAPRPKAASRPAAALCQAAATRRAAGGQLSPSTPAAARFPRIRFPSEQPAYKRVSGLGAPRSQQPRCSWRRPPRKPPPSGIAAHRGHHVHHPPPTGEASHLPSA